MRKSRLLIALSAALLGGLISGCATTTPSPTAISTASAAPATVSTPTSTPRPAPLPSAAPDVPDTHIEVPAWLSDPAASLVMTAYTVNGPAFREGIAIINAATGEYFDIPKDAHVYFWLPDGGGFGWVDSHVNVIASASGKISHFEVTPLTSRLIDIERTVPALASGPDPASPGFFIYPAPNNYGRAEVSEDLRFAAISSDTGLIVEDLQTSGQTTIPRPDSYAEVSAHWLPDGSTLVILRRMGEIDHTSGIGETRLDFFDAAAGQLIASYPGIWMSGYSPDGEEILYAGGGPCILKWRTGERRCLDNGLGIHHTEKVYGFDWSPDGAMVGVMYWNGSGKQGTGGICVKHLDSGDMLCPMLNHTVFNDGVIQNYMWSADSRYLFFIFAESSCPGCDFDGGSHIGMISIDGKVMHYPIEDLQVYPTDTAIWRPAITPN